MVMDVGADGGKRRAVKLKSRWSSDSQPARLLFRVKLHARCNDSCLPNLKFLSLYSRSRDERAIDWRLAPESALRLIDSIDVVAEQIHRR